MQRQSVVITIGLMLICGLNAYADWGAIRQLTVSPDNSNMPYTGRAVAVMGNNLHIVYSDVVGGDRKVLYLRSTDRGVSWSSPTVIDEMSYSYTFSIVADSSGNVHFINRRADGGLWYRRSTDAGATWATAQQVTAEVDVPILLTNGSQNVYILNVTPTTPPQLELYKSTDGGANWNRTDVVSQTGFQSICAATSGSAIHIAYAYGGMGNAQTYYLRSTDNGTTWDSPRQISTSSQTVPVGIWANGNYLFLSFTIFGQTRNFRRSTDGGDNWLNETTLRALINDIAFLPTGVAHALSLKEDNRVLWFYSTDHGASWSDTVKISGDAEGTRAKPQIAVDGMNDLHAFWTSRQTGNVEVFYRFNSLGIEETGNEVPCQPRAKIITPNPAYNVLRVFSTTPVALYDASGKLAAILTPGENNISNLMPGVYFVRQDETSTAKFIKLE